MKFEKFISHRGANTYAPENTMEAFQRALDYGVNWIELDVQLTLDNVPIIFHDYYIERVTGLKKYITNMTLDEVKTLDAAAKFPIRFASCQIPTLQEYLGWMEENPLAHTNVEIKSKPYDDEPYEVLLAQKVIEVLDDFPVLKDKIMISSFCKTIMQTLHETEHAYSLEMLVSFEGKAKWERSFIEFRDQRYSDFQKWQCCALGINGDGLSESRVEELKDLCGTLLTYSSSTFSEQDVRKLLSWGVDSVFIDEVKQIETALTDVVGPLKIGFLATGDEITTGDIQNTNTPAMAVDLYGRGYKIGMHLACYDSQRKIEKSVSYLLSEHDIVITVGGLGPTEDDKTCSALAYVAGQKLVFSEESWQRIVKRLEKRFAVIPETNRQQALFPEHATILPNARGTADGCIISLADNKYIVMLPGPPGECLTMFKNQALPFIESVREGIERQAHNWLLMGIAEAQLSQTLKPIADKYDETFGYRADYPYIELKLHSSSEADKLIPMIDEVEEAIFPYRVCKGKLPASAQLVQHLKASALQVKIKKDVTKGMLYSHFAFPYGDVKPRYIFEINTYGLENFWKDPKAKVDKFRVDIKLLDTHKSRSIECMVETDIFLKGRDSLVFVYEWLCWKILEMLEKETVDGQ